MALVLRTCVDHSLASGPNFTSLSAFAYAELPIRGCFPFIWYPSKFNRPSGPCSENVSVLLVNIRYTFPCAISLLLLPFFMTTFFMMLLLLCYNIHFFCILMPSYPHPGCDIWGWKPCFVHHCIPSIWPRTWLLLVLKNSGPFSTMGSFHWCLSNTNYVSGTVLGSGDTAMNLTSWSLHSRGEKWK